MFDAVSHSLLLILITVSLVLLNGVFVAAEFAIIRVRRTRLEELAGEGNCSRPERDSPGRSCERIPRGDAGRRHRDQSGRRLAR